MFIRGNVPMTKEEVRAVTVAKARLREGQTVWDIGAGTGSLSVEAALQVVRGKVYAVERLAQGIDLIRQNRDNFSLDNLEIIQGLAPEALYDLPDPDRVFIGGSGGQLEWILKYLAGRLRPGGRIVINAVTLETPGRAVEILHKLDFRTDTSQIFAARALGIKNMHLMQGLNPVYIIAAEKGGDNIAG
jgi:precorrin-6Y C5,15-methyltransferase (decarboxylating) CbiT subunit